MTITPRQTLWGIFWALLLASVIWGYCSMRASKERLALAAEQEQKSRGIAKEIQQLRDRPGFAALNVDSPHTITMRAEAARQQAAFPAAAVLRIQPQGAVQLRDSPYRMRPTRLELRGVTLKQVIQFAHAMIDESQGTTIRDLRLTLGNRSGNELENSLDYWTAEMVLTQLIFAPPR